MAVLMEVKDLVTRFNTQEGTVYAVNGVSYTLNEGETLGVVGESGSGKSVQSLAIMGLIPQPPGKIESGSVVFRGRDLLKLSREDMRKVRGAEIAMIFQDPMTSLNPVLTIGRQITEALRLHLGMNNEQARERAAELLAMVGIPMAAQRLNSYPHQFSGGMRQRAMIAMALSCNPQLLIADEPTTALDVTVQAQVLRLIKRLQREMNLGVLFITHDMGVVAEMCDRVAVMYAGQIVEEAPVSMLFERPRHPYTMGLLSSIPTLDHRGRSFGFIPGVVPNLRALPPGCRFSPRCPHSVADICDTEGPALRAVDGTTVRCRRAEDLAFRSTACERVA